MSEEPNKIDLIISKSPSQMTLGDLILLLGVDLSLVKDIDNVAALRNCL